MLLIGPNNSGLLNQVALSCQELSGRHCGIAPLVFSHRGSASQMISAARTRIARNFASHRIAFSVFSMHHHSHRIAARIAQYGPLRSGDWLRSSQMPSDWNHGAHALSSRTPPERPPSKPPKDLKITKFGALSSEAGVNFGGPAGQKWVKFL